VASNIKRCDMCGGEIEEIVAKLYLAPIIRGKTRASHNNYTAYLDIGQCCIEKVMKLGKWQKRLPFKKYNEQRKARRAD
jgi:hypothetical protein